MKRPVCGGLFLLALSSPVVADHEEAYRLLHEGRILPLENILQRQQQTRPGRVLEVELEQEDGVFVYELEVLDEQGAVWQLLFDAHSGVLLEGGRED